MGFSILQTSLALPAVDALKRAFRSVSCLTDIDAHTLAQDAYGIIVKNLSADDAGRLQGALRVEGIETEIVADSALPSLPAAKQVHRLDCLENALMIYDPLGRGFPLEWGHVMVIAAGSVRLTEFKRVERKVARTRFDSQGIPMSVVESEYATKEERHGNLLLEIVLSRAVLRYTANAAHFNFQYLGDRRSPDLESNYALLVRDLLRFAPHAATNQGADCFRSQPPPLFSYPSKNAFYEEIMWLLWKRNQPGGQAI
jgi:hypothetical protein